MNTYNKLIADMFKNALYPALSKVPENHLPRIVRNLWPFFYKWFYSSILDGHLLSPANLLLAEYIHAGKEEFFYPNIKPNKKQGIVFSFDEYSLNSHPFVNDLKVFANQFEHIGNFSFPTTKLLENISIPNVDYLLFLRLVSIELGTVKKHLSINSDMLQKSDECDEILQRSIKHLLCDAANIVVEDCSAKLNTAIPLGNAITKKLNLFLKRPVSVIDEIQEIFSGFCTNAFDNVDFSNHAEYDPEFFEELIETSSKSSFFETILDKCFFMPLSCYLKLVQPVYIDSVHLPTLFSDNCKKIDNSDALPPFVDPLHYLCWGYSFTPLGTSVFEHKNTTGEYEDMRLPANISPAPIFNELHRGFYPAFENEANETFNPKAALPSKLLLNMLKNTGAPVYRFRIFCDELAESAFNIDVEAGSTLDALHNYLACLAGIYPDFIDFSFVVGERNTPFNTYRPDSPIKALNTADATLRSLPILPGIPFRYIIYNAFEPTDITAPSDDSALVFDIMMMGKTQARYGRVYPWHALKT